MNSNLQIKTKLVIMLVFLFALLPVFFNNLNFYVRNRAIITIYYNEFDYKNMKLSEVSGKIHIDNNWTDAKTVGICTGNGTYSEPYVIEDLVIDGGGLGACILIEHSNVYFIIENCTLYNSDYGLYLLNSNNSTILGNIVYNTTWGIYLYSSHNSTLSGNTASNNSNGIDLRYSINNNIIGNTASNNEFAIHFSYCQENTISGNNVINNDYGIAFWYCDNNTISGNTATNNNNGAGIWLRAECSKNIISGNSANNNQYGVHFSASENNKVSENNVNDNYIGIDVYNSDRNTFSGNTASNNFYGINLESSYNNTISGNIMDECGLRLYGFDIEKFNSHTIDSTNLVNGKPLYYYANEKNLGLNNFTNAGQVILVNCTDSFILNLSISSSSNGISLYYCNNNTISGNEVNDNRFGIYIYWSNANNLARNIASSNDWGMSLSNSHNNTISRNTVCYNGIGIAYYNSNNNTITENIINYNSYTGIEMISSNGNKIFLNYFDNSVSTYSVNAVDDGLYNHWDNGSMGNYWADYTGLDADGNGIGDAPYNITGSAGSQDNYPLMRYPFSTQNGGGIPIEMIIVISVVSGGAVIGVATLLSIIRKRKSKK